MRHLSDGTLRRLYDEPLALSAPDRRHYAACARCQDRFTAIAADAGAVTRQLAVAPVRVDPVPAFSRVQRRIAASSGSPKTYGQQPYAERMKEMAGFNRRRYAKPLSGLVAAAALVAALALTPLGTLAQSFITIFEPQQIVAVPVTPSDLQSLRTLPDLRDFGTMSMPTQAGSVQQVHNVAAAAAASGLTVRTPATLPAGIPSNVSYVVLPRSSASFTFSAAKARAAALASGKALPPMPAGLDGSTLRMTVGPAVMTVYGGNISAFSPKAIPVPGLRKVIRIERHLAGGTGHRREIRVNRTAGGDASGNFYLPTLIIGQVSAPRVDSTGATFTQIRDYLLKQPGVSPQLAGEIRSLGDLSTTLPIPVPVNRATAQSVQVQGASGLAIGDNTGVGSLVIWEKNGMVYGVAGTLPESQVLAIANALH